MSIRKHKFSQWEIELKNFNRLARNVLGRRIPVKTVPETEDQLGYTNAKPEIFIAESHPIMDGLSKTDKKMFRMGVLAHEMLHQIFSDFSLLEKEVAKYSTMVEKQLFSTFFNVVEDCNIEYYSSTVMGGVLLKALRFHIKHIYDKSSDIDTYDDTLTQVINALIQLGDMGIVKGKFKSSEAYEIFAKCAIVFNEGVNAREPQGRCDAAKKMMEITKPLWEKEKLSEEEYRKMLESLSKMAAEHSESSGSGKSSSGAGKSSAHAEGSPAGSAASSRRDEVVRAIAKALSDAKKSSSDKKGEGSGTRSKTKSETKSGKGSDLKSGTETESGTGTESEISRTSVGETAEPDMSSKKEASDAKSSSEPAEDGFELLEDDSSEGTDGSTEDEPILDFDETESTSETLDSRETEGDPSMKKDSGETESEKSSGKEDEGDPAPEEESSELSSLKKEIESLLEEAAKSAAKTKDKDCEISKEDEKELESLEKEAEVSLISEEDAFDFGSIDLTVEPTLYDGIFSVYNRDVQPEISEISQYKYSSILSEYGTAIQAFVKKLERLFKNKMDEKEYRKTGKLNIKRYSSSKVTARIFDKKVSPKDIDDLSVFVLVDESGSMRSCFSRGDSKARMDIARESAICFAETFGKLNIPLYVMGFSGEDYRDVDHYHYIKWENTPNTRKSLLKISAKCQNFDAMSVNIAHEILKKRHSAHKILIVLSDGAPCCTRRPSSKLFVETKDEIRKTRKDGIDVLGIAIGNSDTKELQTLYGKNFFHTTDVKSVFTGATKEIMKMVQSW